MVLPNVRHQLMERSELNGCFLGCCLANLLLRDTCDEEWIQLLFCLDGCRAGQSVKECLDFKVRLLFQGISPPFIKYKRRRYVASPP